MRTTLLSTALLISIAASSQTYFYINSIAVDPQAPTTSDMVTIEMMGDLSSTGAFVSNASAVVSGNTVSISITAEDLGGATVLVPHTESIALGMLPAGDYEIVVLGTNVADFAVPSDHQFTVTGGSPCDDLVIDFVRWAAFSDTSVIVHVYNNSTTLFNYPGFVLLNSAGDTLAVETVNYFGIALESTHILTVRPGAIIPNGTNAISLHLWTGFYDVLACTWELDLDLCPPQPCSTIRPTLQNFGGGIVTGDFNWAILTEDLEEVASGTLTMTEIQQFAQDSICLAPGNYQMTCVALQSSTGGQPFYGVETNWPVAGVNAPVPLDTSPPLEFIFYEQCIDGTNVIAEAQSISTILLSQQGNYIFIQQKEGKPLASISLYNTDGRVIFSRTVTSDRTTISMEGVPPGVYIVWAGQERKTFVYLK